MKAVVIARCGSRELLQSDAMNRRWESWSDAKSLIDDLSPAALYTQAYRPNKMHRSYWQKYIRKRGLAAAKKAWWRRLEKQDPRNEVKAKTPAL